MLRGIAILALIAGCDRGGAEEPPSAVTDLQVATVAVAFQDSYRLTQSYTGKLVPRRAVEVGFEIAGKITAVHVDDGDVVKAKMPLATLDATLLESERAVLKARHDAEVAKLNELRAGPRAEVIAAARAQLKAEEAVAELLATQRDRAKRLFDQKSVSEDAYDDAESRAAAAANRVAATREKLNELVAGTRPEKIKAQQAVVAGLVATLAQLEIRIGKSVLHSPFPATVAKRRVEEGAAVAAGQPILRLVENAPWEARLSLPVAIARTLAKDSRHDLDVGGRPCKAKVTSLLPELDPSTLNVEVVLEVETGGSFFAGQLVRLSLPREIAEKGAWIPTTGLVKGIRGLWSCFAVVPADGDLLRIERRDVEILYAEADRAYVRGTVQPGDRIVRNGAHRISNGQLVRLAK